MGRTDHQDTNWLGSLQDRYEGQEQGASSNGQGVCCSRSWSMSRRYEASMEGNRDEKSCGLSRVGVVEI